MSAVMLYATFPNREDAQKTARGLLEKRLIACANIIGNVESYYRWEGQIEQAEEAVMIAKTAISQIDTAIAWIKAQHSYTLPCIITYAASGGLVPFLDWIESETKE